MCYICIKQTNPAPDAAVELAGAEDEEEVHGLELGDRVDVRGGAEQPGFRVL
jgi:hypothetical protein